jgi:uncharacterized protein (DUF983 family)
VFALGTANRGYDDFAMKPAGTVTPWIHTRTSRPVLTGRAVARAISRGFRQRCPVCGEGRLFRSAFQVHEECPVCGVGFNRESGLWLGSLDLNLTLSLLILLLPVVFVPAIGLPEALLIWCAGAVIVPAALFRFVRGFWVALVFLSGGVY